MKLEGWKNFPTPNPWFRYNDGSDTRFNILKVTTKLLLLVYFVGLFSLPFVSMFVSGSGLFFQIMAGCFLVWIALWPVVYAYKQVGYGRVLAKAEIIPAYTDDDGESFFFVILVEVPLFLLGCSMGLIGGFLLRLERSKTTDIGVTFMHDGREKRAVMLVPSSTPEEITQGDSIWITKPDFLLPPKPVDRQGRLGLVDYCTIEADKWFDRAIERSEDRQSKMKELKRRARLNSSPSKSGKDQKYNKKL